MKSNFRRNMTVFTTARLQLYGSLGLLPTWQMASRTCMSDALNSTIAAACAVDGGGPVVATRYDARSAMSCGVTVVGRKYGLVMRCSTTGNWSIGFLLGAGRLVLLNEEDFRNPGLTSSSLICGREDGGRGECLRRDKGGQ